jgi:ABC-type spermidine/putrescine transport system permease subunit II/DNA-binding beta-propeller fold protein YncE
LAVGLPLMQLSFVKRTWTELPGALAAGQGAIWNSFWFAAVSATVIVSLALAAGAWARGTKQPRLAGSHGTRSAPISSLGFVVGWLSWLPFLIPGVLLGISLIVVFNRPWTAGFYQGAGIVILAFVIRYLAPGWNTVIHALGAVDPDLTDAARLDGATRWQMLRYVHWPQIAPQVAAAWYVVFLLCLWDVESMILVVPPGGETLALRVFNLLHYGHNAQVNALCLTLLAVAVAPLCLSCLLGRALPFHASRSTHHAPRLTLVALLFLAGCGSRPASNDSSFQSRLFTHARVIGSRGVGVGELNKPRSVAVDRQDNLYVVDMTGRVQKFSPEGVFLLSWQMPQTDIGKPKGMGRDNDGNIIVVEPHYQRLNHFSTAGRLLAQWGQKGTNIGKFIMPRAVAQNSRGEIFVSEYGEVERVQKFAFDRSQAVLANSGSNALGTLGIPRWIAVFGKPGNGPGEFNRPEGLCVDAQDRLHVADSCNHRIQIFSSDGTFLRAYGKAGSGKGELSYPYDICVDGSGRQYVCEFGNSRIQVFDVNDQPLEIIGGPGAEPGRFNNPWGVALDSAGNLYVADSQNHRVQKLTRR